MAAWTPLQLTSPHMKGNTVAWVQRLLNEHMGSRLTVDGDYGIHTAQAVAVAKKHLGYLNRDVDEVAGSHFVGYLMHPENRPRYMKLLARKRAAGRRRKAKATPKRVKALKLLGDHLGTTGYNNIFTRWYGVIGAWCAMTVSWSGAMAGERSFKKGARYSYVPYMTADAVARRNGLSVTHDPQPGDRVIYHWPGGNPMGDHTGTFKEWTNRDAGEFVSRDGNTSDVNGHYPTGGILADKLRYTTDVVYFVRVAE